MPLWLLLLVLVAPIIFYIVVQVGGTIALKRGESDIEWLFVTHVAGVSHRNRDRRSRQKIIRESCYAGQFVKLVPEPENKHDENAIAVYLPAGEQIGYLRADVARIAAEHNEAGELVAEITEIVGGQEEKPTLGVVLKVGKPKRRDSATPA